MGLSLMCHQSNQPTILSPNYVPMYIINKTNTTFDENKFEMIYITFYKSETKNYNLQRLIARFLTKQLSSIQHKPILFFYISHWPFYSIRITFARTKSHCISGVCIQKKFKIEKKQKMFLQRHWWRKNKQKIQPWIFNLSKTMYRCEWADITGLNNILEG